VTLQKCFSHPSLVIYCFASPPTKLKLGQQIGEGTTNSKPFGPIIIGPSSVSEMGAKSKETGY
jgi:hypothetical protein